MLSQQQKHGWQPLKGQIMSYSTPYMYPAKIVSYDAVQRTARVSINGLTDGLNEGIVAMLAYPIGDDDRDTERELLAGADVWVFFESGDTTAPVIAFYRGHGEGLALVNIRRIRQENIELLARANITLQSKDLVYIKSKSVTIEADTFSVKASQIDMQADEANLRAQLNHVGDHFTTGDHVVNGGQTINGSSVSYGNQDIYGKMTISIDLVVAGISSKNHLHGNGNNGSDTTKPKT